MKIFFSLKWDLTIVDIFCNFCSITGELSISSRRYDPPCKSRPRLIFLSRNLLFDSKRLFDAIKIKNRHINEMNIILNLEKYNIL